MFPSSKPEIAEVFGVSIVAAIVWLMDLQIKWHGKPINSGFYEAYLLKGGYPRAYLCSKYLKAVVSNFFLVLVLLGLIYGMRIMLISAPIVAFFWCFINPLFVLSLSSSWTINFNMDYRFVQQRLRFLALGTGILSYFTAGVIAFSQGKSDKFI